MFNPIADLNFLDASLFGIHNFFGIPSNLAPPLCHLNYRNSIRSAPFQWEKSCKWVIGLHRQSAPTWSDKKKADPMTNFVPNFSDDPRCAPIKSYGQALVPIVPFSIWESASLCGMMRVFRNVNRISRSYGRVTLVSRRLHNDIATRSRSQLKTIVFQPNIFLRKALVLVNLITP